MKIEKRNALKKTTIATMRQYLRTKDQNLIDRIAELLRRLGITRRYINDTFYGDDREPFPAQVITHRLRHLTPIIQTI